MSEGRGRVRRASMELVGLAGEMRRSPTAAEERLWEALRLRRLDGLRFRRQYPIGRFILDFCCPDRRLVVEVDGAAHEIGEDRDQARTEQLESRGYRVLRFKNEMVMADLDRVLDEVRRAAGQERE